MIDEIPIHQIESALLSAAVPILLIVLGLAVLNLGWVVGALGFVFAALAFAGQDFVRDYLAGLFILVENQFYVGDVIQVTGMARFISCRTGRFASPRITPVDTPESTSTCRSPTTPTSSTR